MSPLGRYAEGVAALVSLSIVGTWLTMMLLGATPPDKLDDAVLIALGYVFVKGGVQAGESISTRAHGGVDPTAPSSSPAATKPPETPAP